MRRPVIAPLSSSFLSIAPHILSALRLGLMVVACAGVWRVPLRAPMSVLLPLAATLSASLTIWLSLSMPPSPSLTTLRVRTGVALIAAILDWLWVGLIALPDLGLGPATGALVVLLIALHGIALAPQWSLLTDVGGIAVYATLGAGGWLLVPADTLRWQVGIYVVIAAVISRIAAHLRQQTARFDMLAGQFEAYRSAQSALLHALPVGVVVLDADLRPYYANDGVFGLLGVSRPAQAEVFAEALQLEQPMLAARLRALVNDVHRDGLPRRERCSVAEYEDLWNPDRVRPSIASEDRKLGVVTARPIRIDATRLPNADGTAAIGLVVADARDEVLLNHFVRQAERGAAVRELAGALAHELRNPLMAITTAAQVLKRGDARNQQAATDLILTERDRVRRLLDEFLQFSRVPAHVAYHGIDMRAWLTQLVAGQNVLAQERGVEVVLLVDPGLPSVDADAELLTRALTNVLGNARRYSSPGSTIHVTARRARPEDWQRGSGVAGGRAVSFNTTDAPVVIAVRDTGPGLSSHVVAHLGQPFVKTAEGGTGLGLAIVRRVVALHGGILRIENMPVGGAEVRMIIPHAAPARVSA